MRTSLFIIAILFLFPVLSFSQDLSTEGKRVMSQGTQNSFSLLIDNLASKEVDKLWMDYLKNTKAKKPTHDRKTDEYFADDAALPAISANTVDVYATIKERGENQVELVVWFDLGGAYLSTLDHADKVPAAQAWLGEFARLTRVRKVEIELEGEETKLKDLNKDFAKLQKEQENLQKAILEAEKKIEEAKKGLETNAASQKNRMKEIEDQQKMVEQVKEKLKKVE